MRIVWAVLALIIALLAAGCGGGGDAGVEKVTLYFADDVYLTPVERELPRGTPATPEAALEELIKGPDDEKLSPTIPRGTVLLGLEVKDGVAYVNFSEEFVINHWGGSTGEALTLNSVVNTLTEFPEIDSVVFMVQGEPIDTLAGHVYLGEPLKRNEGIIAK